MLIFTFVGVINIWREKQYGEKYGMDGHDRNDFTVVGAKVSVFILWKVCTNIRIIEVTTSHTISGSKRCTEKFLIYLCVSPSLNNLRYRLHVYITYSISSNSLWLSG